MSISRKSQFSPGNACQRFICADDTYKRSPFFSLGLRNRSSFENRSNLSLPYAVYYSRLCYVSLYIFNGTHGGLSVR